MVKTLLSKGISWVLKLTVSIILCVGITWRICLEYREVKFRVLNILSSGLSALDAAALGSDSTSLEPAVMRQFARYFQYIAQVIPGRADAWAMTGFCLAKLNRFKDALTAYEKAASMNAHMVWVYYNLGVLYLKQGDFIKAQANFKKAIDVPVEANVIMVQNSKVYLDILRQCPQINMEDRLKETYTLSYQLVQISARMRESDAPAISDLDPSWTAPRIF